MAGDGILRRMSFVSEVTGGWSLAEDPDEVHELLCASDRHAAEQHGLTVPRRSRATTGGLVADGCVQVLREQGEIAAMFTLTSRPPYSLAETGFPARSAPRYLQRLAVRPDLLRAGSLIGVQSVARAIELSTAQGADALRAEANPDLVGVLEMLLTLGFRRYGEPAPEGPLRRVYLQRDLAGA